MSKTAKFWSVNVVLATGVLISPLAAPVLQLLNYQSADEKRGVRNSALWILAMLIAVIGWNIVPLELPPIAHLAVGGVFAFVLVVIWFFAYGRHFPKKVDSGILASATSRSVFLGVGIAIGVAVLSHYTASIAIKALTQE